MTPGAVRSTAWLKLSKKAGLWGLELEESNVD